jgi:hypothetical protein
MLKLGGLMTMLPIPVVAGVVRLGSIVFGIQILKIPVQHTTRLSVVRTLPVDADDSPDL